MWKTLIIIIIIYRMKIKEFEKIDEYLDFARELKN